MARERLDDLGELFRRGGASWCSCAYFRMRSGEFSAGTTTSHRAELERAVDATATARRAPGLVAYRDGVPIGWVSVGPRDDYPRLEHSKALAPVDAEPAWSVVCFVVSRTARGQRVARTLLDAAIDYARGHGAAWLEAYPAADDGQRIADVDAYKGTVSMFQRAGFEIISWRRANRASPERPIMRKRM